MILTFLPTYLVSCTHKILTFILIIASTNSSNLPVRESTFHDDNLILYSWTNFCWPKGYTLRFMRFDDNKTYKSYLVLIEVLEWFSGLYKSWWLKRSQACYKVDGSRGLTYRIRDSSSAKRFRDAYLWIFVLIVY